MKKKILNSIFNIQNRKIYFIVCICLLFALTGLASGKDAAKTGRVSGKIECEDKSKTFGYICFYVAAKGIPDSNRFFRPTADYVFSLMWDGSFDVSLPEGKYYMLAFRRSGNDFGPLVKEDYFMFLLDCTGNPRSFEVKAGDKVDLGVINTIPYVPFQGLFNKAEVTAIRGVVRDESGQPVKDIFVIAYDQPSMLGRPNYVSRLTDEEGRYELLVKGGGSYYLAAASAPGRGDYYGQAGDEAVTIKSGDSLEINITVIKVQ